MRFSPVFSPTISASCYEGGVRGPNQELQNILTAPNEFLLLSFLIQVFTKPVEKMMVVLEI